MKLSVGRCAPRSTIIVLLPSLGVDLSVGVELFFKVVSDAAPFSICDAGKGLVCKVGDMRG